MSKDWSGRLGAKGGSWTLSPKQSEVRLVGNFCCLLTCEEENEWHDFIQLTDIFREHRRKKDRLGVLMSAHYELQHETSVNMILAEYKEWRIIENQLYVIGRDWYADLEARREKGRQAKVDAERAEQEKDKP